MVRIKPLIGVTSASKERKEVVSTNYINAITRSGGLPVILPNIETNEEAIAALVYTFSGFLVTGGEDVDPTLYGEEPHPELGNVSPRRDAFELALIKEVTRQDKPILAICRGSQILNVAMGGDLYQDVYAQKQETTLLQHRQRSPLSHPTHYVQTEENTLLHQLVGKKRFKVNSNHHQTVRKVAPSFIISAMASDGLIEAVESTRHTFVLGVQWHPEAMIHEDILSQRLFHAFIKRCTKGKKNAIEKV